MTILHLVGRDDWEADAEAEHYVAASLQAEGFIHCSADVETLLAVANTLYREHPGELVVLEIDEARLSSEVRWEAAVPAPPPGVQADVRFPHVYGPIERSAVTAVRALRRDGNGTAAGLAATSRGSSPSAPRTRRA